MMNFPPPSSSRGAAAIYLVLLLTFMFTSSALIISFSLSRQLQATSQITSSARAFYAATSGIEKGLMDLVTNPDADTTITIEDTLSYDQEDATVSGTARFSSTADNPSLLQPCVATTGDFGGQQRRAELGGRVSGCAN